MTTESTTLDGTYEHREAKSSEPLKHKPVNPTNQTPLKTNYRKLRLTEEFFDKDNNNDDSLALKKSKYNSTKGRDKTLDNFVNT